MLARVDTALAVPGLMHTHDSTDATGTIGVEAFDVPYGAGFEVDDASPHALDCELVEDGGAFVAHRPEAAARPRRVAFVDGTMRTEARLTHTGPEGDLTTGLAGSWAAGAVLVTDDGPAGFDRIRGRADGNLHRRAGDPPARFTATDGAGNRTPSRGATSRRPGSTCGA